MQDAPLVLVTGITGFLGSHCARHLIESGYRVRGSVRSLRDEYKLSPVRALQALSETPIELVEADLLAPDKWPAAVAGCRYVLHVASPFTFDIHDDPDAVIKPAVEGTLSVLRAVVADAGSTIRRVVLTSSLAAIITGRNPVEKVWTGDDWADLATPVHAVPPYYASKYLAERAAWDFLEALPDDQKFELSVICPGFITGPQSGPVAGTTALTCSRLLKGQEAAVPHMLFPGVDVRDVAHAHVMAMTADGAAGQRFVCAPFEFSLREGARLLAEEFNPLGYRVSSLPLPSWIVPLLSHLDPTLEAIAPYLGHRIRVDNGPAERVLKIAQWRGFRDSWIEEAYSLLEHDIVPDRRRVKSAQASL